MKRMGKQIADWKEIYANHTSNKRLESRIYKDCSKLNDNKKNQIKNEQKTETNISLKKIYKCQKST